MGAMKRQAKAERIAEILERLYPLPPIPLLHEDPYTLLIAVLLSAQSTDKKVNEITPKLFQRASTPAAMAQLSVAEIKHEIREIGLSNSKAKNIRALSELLVEEHGGEVPDSFAALEALPGVGHKTASVVMAQAFGKAAFPVDTHIHRLAHRWGLTRGTTVEHTERDLKKVFHEDAWSKVHLQIIYFGREHCPANFHDLSACPICGWAATKKQIALEAKRNQALRDARKKKKTGKKTTAKKLAGAR